MSLPSILRTIILSLALVTVVTAAFPLHVHAQVEKGDVDALAGEFKIVKGGDLIGSIKKVVNWLLTFLGLVAVLVIMYGGMQYILSQGEESKAENGKRVVLFAIIGLVIIGISAVIVNSILNVIAP